MLTMITSQAMLECHLRRQALCRAPRLSDVPAGCCVVLVFLQLCIVVQGGLPPSYHWILMSSSLWIEAHRGPLLPAPRECNHKMIEVKQNLAALHESQMTTKILEMEKVHKTQMEDANKRHQAALATLQQGHKTDLDACRESWNAYVQSDENSTPFWIRTDSACRRSTRPSWLLQKTELSNEYEKSLQEQQTRRNKELAEVKEELSTKKASLEFWRAPLSGRIRR